MEPELLVGCTVHRVKWAPTRKCTVLCDSYSVTRSQRLARAKSQNLSCLLLEAGEEALTSPHHLPYFPTTHNSVPDYEEVINRYSAHGRLLH